jgi:hypothetical protein
MSALGDIKGKWFTSFGLCTLPLAAPEPGCTRSSSYGASYIVTMVPPHPLEPAVLNASNLESLATQENRVKEFVTSQTRYAKAQANEGRAVRASWDISTPEKDQMHLHQPSAGFETPVLRPRAVETVRVRVEPDLRRASQPHPTSSTNNPTPQSPEPVRKGKAKATSAFRESVSPKAQKKPPENKPTKKRSGASNPRPTRKERRARSDTDEEHLASMSSFLRPFSTVHRDSRVPCNRVCGATRTQACEAGDYEPTRSQGKHEGRERKQRRRKERP